MLRELGFAAAIALFPVLASAQETATVARVAFHNGRASVRGSVTGYEKRDYVFPAGAGESLSLRFKSDKGGAYFNLTAPGAQEALFIGSVSGDRYSGAAPVAGDYTARVYLMRNEARRGARANYTLTIELGLKSPAKPHGPDFADGLSGGPDYWEVTGVPEGDRLNVRATPSANGRRVAQLANAAVVKNLGGRMIKGQRWIKIEDGAGRRGWVNGTYLREAASPPQ